MIDLLLEWSHRDDSNRWSNIVFGKETTQVMSIEVNCSRILSGALIHTYLRIHWHHYPHTRTWTLLVRHDHLVQYHQRCRQTLFQLPHCSVRRSGIRQWYFGHLCMAYTAVISFAHRHCHHLECRRI